MGTRCLTVFQENNGKEIVVMYRQFDGYPEAHGKELVEFLKGRVLVDGFSGEECRDFNGMGCLAAQAVKHFKGGVGGFYLYAAGTRDVGEEYTYTISPGGAYKRVLGERHVKDFCLVMLKIEDGNTVVYNGPAHEFDAVVKG